MDRWCINYGGVEIELEVGSPAAKALVAESLAGLHMVRATMPSISGEGDSSSDGISDQPANSSQPIRLSVEYLSERWHLKDHSTGAEQVLHQEGDFIYHLSDRIVFHVADKTEGQHCVHAAAVAKNDKALMIPADSGSGKSSFTTWLAANGFDYLSDELVLIDDDGQLTGIARPIQIKVHGLEAIKPLLKPDAEIYRGGFANAIPLQAITGQAPQKPSTTDTPKPDAFKKGAFQKGAPKLAAFVFPKYTAGAPYSFERISSADAGMRLMSNHVNARNLEGHGFKRMMGLIRETPCYALSYGGFDTLPTDFGDSLAQILK